MFINIVQIQIKQNGTLFNNNIFYYFIRRYSLEYAPLRVQIFFFKH